MILCWARSYPDKGKCQCCGQMILAPSCALYVRYFWFVLKPLFCLGIRDIPESFHLRLSCRAGRIASLKIVSAIRLDEDTWCICLPCLKTKTYGDSRWKRKQKRFASKKMKKSKASRLSEHGKAILLAKFHSKCNSPWRYSAIRLAKDAILKPICLDDKVS